MTTVCRRLWCGTSWLTSDRRPSAYPGDDVHSGSMGHHIETWFGRVVGKLAISYIAASADEEGGTVLPADESAVAPEAEAMTRELHTKLRALVAELSSDAAQLIRDVYFEGKTLQEAGAALGVSKSWASRLHARALEKLAFEFRAMGVDSPVEST